MNPADGGKGFFFKEDGKEGTVLAMKNSILPVVAVLETEKILSVWLYLVLPQNCKRFNGTTGRHRTSDVC